MQAFAVPISACCHDAVRSHAITFCSAPKGLTLVELMVAVAINLVLVLAATLLYLNTRSTQKMVDEKSAVSETGQFALALLGRELTLAGFPN